MMEVMDLASLQWYAAQCNPLLRPCPTMQYTQPEEEEEEEDETDYTQQVRPTQSKTY